MMNIPYIASLLLHLRRFLILLLSVCSVNLRADAVGYSGVKDLKTENNELIVTHHHDWQSDAGNKWRFAMITGDQNPFRPENTFSTITAREKSGNKLLFSRPVPALSYLWISPDSRYIVGLSNIKLYNPYQLVIFDRAGNLLLKQRMTPQEACFSTGEYGKFRKQHAKSLPVLDQLTAVKGDRAWIDCFWMDAQRVLGSDIWNELNNRACPSHFSPNFSESVSNWIYWYRTEILKPVMVKNPNGTTTIHYDSTQPPQPADPELKMNYQNGRPVTLSLLDPHGVRFSVPIPAKK